MINNFDKKEQTLMIDAVQYMPSQWDTRKEKKENTKLSRKVKVSAVCFAGRFTLNW